MIIWHCAIDRSISNSCSPHWNIPSISPCIIIFASTSGINLMNIILTIGCSVHKVGMGKIFYCHLCQELREMIIHWSCALFNALLLYSSIIIMAIVLARLNSPTHPIPAQCTSCNGQSIKFPSPLIPRCHWHNMQHSFKLSYCCKETIIILEHSHLCTHVHQQPIWPCTQRVLCIPHMPRRCTCTIPIIAQHYSCTK